MFGPKLATERPEVEPMTKTNTGETVTGGPSVVTRLRRRLPLTRRGLAVFGGDLLMILAFVAIGLYEHGTTPCADIPRLAKTLVPFLAVWVVAAPLVGAYRPVALRRYGHALLAVLVSWVLAVAVGTRIRATDLFPGGSSPEFVLVAILFGGLFLVTWRTLAVTVVRYRGA